MTTRVNVVHTSLNEVRMLGGVPWVWSALGWASGGAITVYGSWFAGAPIVGLMLWLRWLHRDDPHKIQVYLQYSREADSYDPWPRTHQFQNQRPLGFKRGLLC
jgi:type IV secretory pathway TrbD component